MVILFFIISRCLDTTNPTIFCLKLSCDINEQNNLGETPIYCAIKNNLINNVRIAKKLISPIRLKKIKKEILL